MKHLYSFTLIASLATIGAVMANPKLFDNISAGLKERWKSWNGTTRPDYPAAPSWDANLHHNDPVAASAAPSTFGGQTGSSTPPPLIAGFSSAPPATVATAPAPVAQAPVTPPMQTYAAQPAPPQFAPVPVPVVSAPVAPASVPTSVPTYSPNEVATYTPMAASFPQPVEPVASSLTPIAEPTPVEQFVSPSPLAPSPSSLAPASNDVWGSVGEPLPAIDAAPSHWSEPVATSVANQIAPPLASPLAPSSYAPPVATSFTPPAAPEAAALSPPVFSEIINVQGADTVARIGTHVVLLCDILPQAKRNAIESWEEKFATLTDAQKSEITAEQRENFIRQMMMAQYPMLLQDQIQIALLYNDFVASRKRDEVEAQEKRVGTAFDQEEVGKLVKALKVENVAALKLKLKNDYATSLERERLLFTRKAIAFGWLSACVGEVESQCTHDEMLDYYNRHKSDFEQKGKARWQELFTKKGGATSDRDAWNKLAWMGNAVSSGASMDQIAREHSEGTKASSGGVWDWMTRGNLASQQLDDTIFTAPVGQLSQIIETPQGFYIVRVLERVETSFTPFVDTQATIREKICNERRQEKHVEYFTQLQKRYPIEITKTSLQLNQPTSTATQTTSRMW
ncbi:MAG: peptidylprolyl isomerase [Thermoguttaceae bacterium]